MPVIRLSGFAGEKPLLNPRLLPETAATASYGVRLDDGALTPMRSSKLIATLDGATNAQTIYQHQGEWLTWEKVVHAAPGPVAQDRLYYTGDGAPKMRLDGVVYDLALPRPEEALVVGVTGDADEDADPQTRTYCYTLVTSFGEESAPCSASELVDWKPGQEVTLSGFSVGPVGRSVTLQRIYRSQTATSGTYFYLIAERAVTEGDFVDTVDVDDIQDALPSQQWDAPPDGLSGLVSMANGMMAAFFGRTVYFCEPYRPHAWPETYTMTVDADIVGLGALDAALIVMTKGRPYIMSGTAPDSVVSRKLEAPWPCINARAIVDLGFAICYPTKDGLVQVGADGSISLATTELFSRETWLEFSPETAVAGQDRGIYTLFYDYLNGEAQRLRGCLLINVNAAQYLSRVDEHASAVFVSEADASLYLTRSDDPQVLRFNDPDGLPSTFYWRSKEFMLVQPVNMSAILIDLGRDNDPATVRLIEEERERVRQENESLFNGDLDSAVDERALNTGAIGSDNLLALPRTEAITCNIYADGKVIASKAIAGQILRLPAGFKARKWQIDVSANSQISQIAIASSVDELRGQ
ncbi:hypothetical protein C8N35_11623 [Breoghania corrubedonensis]|uniref:Uncharacterized protein n=1 Tax=Breoghania corrubedonensis TaxID=665038 RepID=A0A2T5UPX3_9HYPH|nr:hypothetical protein [Breoghania corrubedonensis]PTW53568.1 hypothetical protein C8N35_11623 [Breoghania corrubedonensis]